MNNASIKKQISEQVHDRGLWWYLENQGKHTVLTISDALSVQLNREVNSLEQLFGQETASLLKSRLDEIQEAYASGSEYTPFNFVSEFVTNSGTICLHNKIQAIGDTANPVFVSTCLEMADVHFLGGCKFTRHEQTVNRGRLGDSITSQSRFLAMLSHELRSPLLGISSLVQRLRKNPDVADRDAVFKSLSMTAEQSTYLVNDILTYSQAEYEGLSLHKTSNSLSEILENVKMLTQTLATDKGLELTVSQSVNNSVVLVDAVRLTQVLINLVINAIKFTKEGKVSLELNQLASGKYAFIVSDSGQGIETAKLAKVFNPFAQIEPQSVKSAHPFSGAGLGLYVVKQLVNLMGSEVEVNSRLNHGTEFRFVLALEPSQGQENLGFDDFGLVVNEEQSEATFLAQEKEQIPLKVLVADDSEINRMVIDGYLADVNCQVVEAENGHDAWNLLQEDAFDYVLLDIQMPLMDGVEVAAKLHEAFVNQQQPQLKGVFAITAGGESSKRDYSEMLSKGVFDEWLFKPVNKQQIIRLFNKDYRNQSTSSDHVSEGEHSDVVAAEVEAKAQPNQLNESADSYQPDVDDVPQALQHLVAPFVIEASEKLNTLLEFSRQNQLEDIKKMAHYLKGNAMLFQLEPLTVMFKNLELLQESKHNNESRSLKRHKKTEELVAKIQIAIKSLEKSLSIGHNND